jgi:hypothetical protein
LFVATTSTASLFVSSFSCFSIIAMSRDFSAAKTALWAEKREPYKKDDVSQSGRQVIAQGDEADNALRPVSPSSSFS